MSTGFPGRPATAPERGAPTSPLDAQKLEHQRWGRKLYAGARENAFQEVKQQNAERWTEVRKIGEPKARDAAAVALKGEQKAMYAKAPRCRSRLRVPSRTRPGRS